MFLRAGLASWFAVVTVAHYAWSQGDPIGPEFRVNTFTTGYQSSASVARSASGDFVVVWDSLNQGLNIYGQRYVAAGSPVGAEFAVNEMAIAPYTRGRVASDPSGNFVVVWSDFDRDIKARRFSSSGGSLGPEFRVNTVTGGDQVSPSVALDGAGNFVVVWIGLDGSGAGILGQRFASTGAPLGPEFRVNTHTFTDQRYPSVASDAAGGFVVVWQGENQDGFDYGIFGQRYSSSGAPAGPEFRVNTTTADTQWSPSVASDGSGGFVAVWLTSMYPVPAGWVFGQRYAGSGAPQGPQFEVSPGQGKRSPTVAADAQGNFVVAWSSYAKDGSSYGVFGQRYDGSGTPLAPEFRVNTYTTGVQGGPSVSVDSSGSFVIVWTGSGTGDTFGIFGQRFSMIVPVELQSFRVE